MSNDCLLEVLYDLPALLLLMSDTIYLPQNEIYLLSPPGDMVVLHILIIVMVVKRGVKQVFFCPINAVYVADCFHWL